MTGHLANHVTTLSQWLQRDALPLWSRSGLDQINGGFFETLSSEGRGVRGNRRLRVQPRQIFCFVEAGRRGWQGPWREAVEHGLTYLDRAYLREDGLYGSVVSDEGEMIDDRFDPYNQAFVIFAFSQYAMAVPERAQEYAQRAETVLAEMQRGYRHPEAGFEEGSPRILPLCSNPHMHLLEAALSWEAVVGRGSGPWSALADEMAGLCLERFIEPRTGALREFFSGDWGRYPGAKGRIVEPGHHFEWTWLLARWSVLRGNPKGLAEARRLFDIASKYGICADRKVAVMTLTDDFAVYDDIARLWVQTEWMKAALLLAELSEGREREAYVASAGEACAALLMFLETQLPGLWHDKMRRDGSFVEEASPASSFYHIVCAIAEMQDGLERLAASEPAPMVSAGE